MSIAQLYDPLISRDVAAIPAAVRDFRGEHSAEELYSALMRFSVLAFNPSQHGKHMFLALVAAADIEEQLADRYEELLIQCAIYAAQSRLPWSEPPISDAPDHDSELVDLSQSELRNLLYSGDRTLAEKWLGTNLEREGFARTFFTSAAEDFSDFGHSLIVAAAAWRYAESVPAAYRFAVLRTAVWEWVSRPAEMFERMIDPLPRAELLSRLLGRLEESAGATDAFHHLVLFEAGITAAPVAGSEIDERVRRFLTAEIEQPVEGSAPDAASLELEPPIYPLARDYAEYLKSFSIQKRLAASFPAADLSIITRMARWNLLQGPSFEEWSFA